MSFTAALLCDVLVSQSYSYVVTYGLKEVLIPMK